MATVVGHRLLRKDSLETVEKPVCYRYAADMLSICFRYAFGVLLENRNPTAWAIQSERDLPASSLCHARSVFQKVIRVSTLNTCAAFVAWTNTHVQIQSKAFFQVLRQCEKILVFTNYDLNTLVPRTGCVSDAIILEELASRLRLTSSGRHLFCEFAPQGESTPTEYRQHIDSISTAYR